MAEVDTQEKTGNPESLGAFAAKANQKVQLDVDDAPFLLPEEETPPVPAPSSLPVMGKKDKPDKNAGKAKISKKKLIIGGSAGILVLLALVVAAWWFLWGSPPTDVSKPEPTVIIVPSPKSAAGPPQFKIEFAPFMVEQHDGKEVHFLQARFTGISFSEVAIHEAKKKQLILRDSIYYYLRNKTHQYLVNPDNAMTIKQDLQDIVNDTLTQGKMDDILLVNYVMK